MTNSLLRRILLSLALLGYLLRAYEVWPQEPQCRDDIPASAGYIVRSVTVQARWGRVPPLDLPLVPGEVFSPEKLSAAHRAVARALDEDPLQRHVELLSRGEISVRSINSCVQVVEGSKSVDVVIRPTTLRLSLFGTGSNILPLPRSNTPTFFAAIPKPLLALNPRFEVNQDRAYGVSERLAVSTNLLDLPAILAGGVPAERDIQLHLDASGRKSLDEPFYETGARLSLSHHSPAGLLASAALDAGFRADHVPYGKGDYLRNAARFGGRLLLRSDYGAFRRVMLGGDYQWSTNRLFRDGRRPERARENALRALVLSDGRVWDGFSRFTVWGNVGFPEDGGAAYQRLAGLLGYEKEFSVALNQTIGVEAVFGGGRAWGDVPGYARFYGGNQLENFLYDPVDSPMFHSFPAGPLLRGIGTGRAGAGRATRVTRGGTSYWHANLNLTLPIPAWSYPLIPPIGEDEGDDTPSVRTILKGQVGSAKNSIAALLKSDGMPEAEARARAEKDVREIRSAVAFLTDYANLFSVKPLVMFDIARVDAPGSAGNRTRIAVGGGVQLTVVVAKFEIGYLRTVRRVEGDGRGNIVMRLVFQNLF